MSVLSIVLIVLAVAAAVGAAVLWRMGTPEKPARPVESVDKQPKAEEEAPARSFSSVLPGAARKQRRAWAQEHDFEYRRHDDYLVDEWSRGAAASGGQARDFVIGAAYGHEVFLMELGGVPVIAMRTGQASEVVADFRRGAQAEASEDLIRVAEVGDFVAYGTVPGAVERLIDIRTTTSLGMLPQAVVAVWMESDWVLAECENIATATDFNEILAPLAMLADAARVLPPRTEVALSMTLEDHAPTRPMPAPPAPDLVGSLVVEPSEKELPIMRPDEPLEMPSRINHETFGRTSSHDIGSDKDIVAIGDDDYTPEVDSSLPRVTRDLDGRSQIFEDHEHPTNDD